MLLAADDAGREDHAAGQRLDLRGAQNDDQSLSAEKLTARLGDGIGQITRLAGGSALEPPRTGRTRQRRSSATLIEQTRLGIPAMVHDECCSGVLARNATNFPQIIGLASTWEPEAGPGHDRGHSHADARRWASITGLAPVLDIARDPRWGRIEETFGEDPYLTSCMGVAYVRGLQGEDWPKASWPPASTLSATAHPRAASTGRRPTSWPTRVARGLPGSPLKPSCARPAWPP